MNCSIPNRQATLLVRIFFLLTFLTAALSPLSAQEHIQWESVDGADHYEVEIRQDGELVLQTRTGENWLPLFLPAGSYEFQVRVINTFGKTSSESSWSPLLIRGPAIPFVIALSPSEIHEETIRDYTARVSGYVPDTGEGGTLFRLESEDEKPIDLEIETAAEGEGWTELKLSSGRKDPELGTWKLVMTNPDGRENTMENALEVTPNLRPRIRSVSPNEIPAGKSHNPLNVKIAGLESGADIRFHGPSPVQAALIPGDDGQVLEYSLDLTEAVPGWYSISVTNPSGDSDVKEKAFEVLPRPLTPEEIAAQHALKIDEKEPLPLADHPRALFFGYAIGFPIGATTEYYNPGWFGLTLGYSQDFHNDFFRKLYWLKGLSWDVTLDITHHQTTYTLYDVELTRIHFLLGLTYVSPFEFPVNFLLRAASGLGISDFNSPDVGSDEDIGGFTLNDLGSMDYVMKFGAGMRISIGSRWYINVVCDVAATFYLSRSAWVIQPRLEGGWRL